MNKTIKYLEEFKAEAGPWFQQASFVKERYDFFREFFLRENLEKADWADFQKIRSHLHCFTSFAVAGGKAFGDPIYPIEQYRNSYIYLAHGSEPVVERIRNFASNPEYQLKYLGQAAISELVGYLFPDEFIFMNGRDEWAFEFLGLKAHFTNKDDLAQRLVKFAQAVQPVGESYLTIVGKQTDLPLNLEIDQFFSWLYERYSRALPVTGCYWWLNADPKIWDFEKIPVGETQIYTSHNEKGNKRQKYKYFQEVQPGDLVLGYITAPAREIVAVCQITKSLHKSPEGEAIEIRKIEQLTNAISYDDLKDHPDLKQCEPINNNRGSLFRVKPEEYEVILSLMDEANPPVEPAPPYTKEDAMKSLFLSDVQFDQMLRALREKKNLLLQGPPGVGKTFVAKRLAYALMGARDDTRIEMVQFHQSYSYEDFIQGYRPADKGGFELKNGIFYLFSRKAQRDPKKRSHVFIIDEINRGNLSRIFGELMMLIEPDKRGEEFAIPLTYSRTTDDRFHIPENLYIIGLMNTADRSLALVDYALRRRFRFITLRPEFQSQAFRNYLQERGLDTGLINKIISGMTALNEAITSESKNLGAGYQIGHSYFCPLDGVRPDLTWYQEVVESEVRPLLQEYWFDDEGKVESLIRPLQE